MTGVDQGNVYARALKEKYTSATFEAGEAVAPFELEWEGKTPFGSSLAFELRGASSLEQLKNAVWQALPSSRQDHKVDITFLKPERWWQCRVTLADGRASSPVLSLAMIKFAPR